MIWKYYDVNLEFTGKVMGGIPKNKEMIKSWLESTKMRESKFDKEESNGIKHRTLNEIEEEIIENRTNGEDQVDIDKENSTWVGFLSKDGIYARCHQIKAHMKDCANQIKSLESVSKIKSLSHRGKVSALKSKVANKVYLDEEINYFLRNGSRINEVDGSHEHGIRVITAQGERSALKRNDYIIKPTLNFKLKVLDDGVIKADLLALIFEYGSVHGMFSERGHGYGQYKFTINAV